MSVTTLVQVEDRGCERLTPAEGQELAGEQRAAVGRLPDLLHVGPARASSVQVAEENVAEAADRGEHVVEVVGDTAGEPAHRIHPLRLAELLLALVQRGAGAGPLADIGGEHQPRPPAIQLQLVRHQLHVDRWCRPSAGAG